MNSHHDRPWRWAGLLGGLTLLFGGSAFAQTAAPTQPNVLPTNPTSPAEFPAPVPRARVAPAPAPAKSGGEVGGYSGGDMVLNEKVTRRGRIPEFHVVKKGDSLWRLCDYYYSDPWSWPQLWAYNKTITNPHWIYPGDRIRMLAHTPAAAPQRRSSGPGFAVLKGGRGSLEQGPIRLQQRAFLDDEQLAASGSIAGSKHENRMLSRFQEVYLKGGDKFKPKVGEHYTIYAKRKKISSSKRKLGHVVEILGTLRIKRVPKEGVVTAEITNVRNVIERGALVGPLRRTFKQLPSRPAKKNMKARIVDFLADTRYVSRRQLVFVDRGRKDGVRNGNRFLVVRRGDGNRTLYQDLERDDDRFPYEPVAEITVLDVRENASVGVVTKANQELRRGDKLRMRRGY